MLTITYHPTAEAYQQKVSRYYIAVIGPYKSKAWISLSVSLGIFLFFAIGMIVNREFDYFGCGFIGFSVAYILITIKSMSTWGNMQKTAQLKAEYHMGVAIKSGQPVVFEFSQDWIKSSSSEEIREMRWSLVEYYCLLTDVIVISTVGGPLLISTAEAGPETFQSLLDFLKANNVPFKLKPVGR